MKARSKAHFAFYIVGHITRRLLVKQLDDFYQLYEECDPLLQHKWTTLQGTVVLYHDGIGQYDKTHTLLSE
jgi:hypothetical protein